MALKLEYASESTGGVLKHIPGPHTQSFHSVDIEWGQRIFVSIKLPGDADDANTRTTLCDPHIYTHLRLIEKPM